MQEHRQVGDFYSPSKPTRDDISMTGNPASLSLLDLEPEVLVQALDSRPFRARDAGALQLACKRLAAVPVGELQVGSLKQLDWALRWRHWATVKRLAVVLLAGGDCGTMRPPTAMPELEELYAMCPDSLLFSLMSCGRESLDLLYVQRPTRPLVLFGRFPKLRRLSVSSPLLASGTLASLADVCPCLEYLCIDCDEGPLTAFWPAKLPEACRVSVISLRSVPDDGAFLDGFDTVCDHVRELTLWDPASTTGWQALLDQATNLSCFEVHRAYRLAVSLDLRVQNCLRHFELAVRQLTLLLPDRLDPGLQVHLEYKSVEPETVVADLTRKVSGVKVGGGIFDGISGEWLSLHTTGSVGADCFCRQYDKFPCL